MPRRTKKKKKVVKRRLYPSTLFEVLKSAPSRGRASQPDIPEVDLQMSSDFINNPVSFLDGEAFSTPDPLDITESMNFISNPVSFLDGEAFSSIPDYSDIIEIPVSFDIMGTVDITGNPI